VSVSEDSVELQVVDVRIHGRYLVRPAVTEAPSADVLVGFHGFGENAALHMEELQRLPGLDSWTLVSVEALHPFYTRAGSIVACWMTSQDREMAIEENVAYVHSVLSRIAPDADGGRLAVLGFSQGTAMAYRAAARCGYELAAVIALGGDVPPELETLGSMPFSRVLIGRGDEEEWYGPESLAADVERLGRLGITPEVLEYRGGHEWTDAFRQRASAFLLAG